MSADGYNSEWATTLVARYSDAYHVANTKVGVGELIKIVGVVVGIVLALVFLFLSPRAEGGGVFVVFLGIAVGTCVAILFYLIGTLVAAQGQILRATLDTAVNTSTFLTPTDRAAAMSLVRKPVGAAAQSAGSKVSSAATWNCPCGRSNPWSASTCLSCGAPEPT